MSIHVKQPTETEQQDLLAQLDAARDRLDERAEVNRRIAAWRDDLRERLWRRQQIFELASTDVSEDEHRLADEVRAFSEVCLQIRKGGAA